MVGATRNASAMAEFALLFHVIASITNLLNFLTTNHPMNHTECHLQHALSTTRRHTFNLNVVKLFDFVLERHKPYSMTDNVVLPLHNVLTKLNVDKVVAARLLMCLDNGEHVYRSYSQERLVEKIKKISMTISKRKLFGFNDQPQMTPATIQKEKKNISSKELAEVQKIMDIAKEWGMDIKQILAHNVLSASTLFNGDLLAHANKSTLLGEIEPKLDHTQWHQKYTLGTHVVVDFMSKMRQMPLGHFPNLGVVIDAIITSASCISHESDCIRLVLDSYIEMSPKAGERMRRTDPTTGINIVGMTRDTPIPQPLDKFWSSQENKQNLQQLVRDTVCNGHYANTTIIASSVVSDDEVLPAKANGGAEIRELLNWTEVAGIRLVLHVEGAVLV